MYDKHKDYILKDQVSVAIVLRGIGVHAYLWSRGGQYFRERTYHSLPDTLSPNIVKLESCRANSSPNGPQSVALCVAMCGDKHRTGLH